MTDEINKLKSWKPLEVIPSIKMTQDIKGQIKIQNTKQDEQDILQQEIFQQDILQQLFEVSLSSQNLLHNILKELKERADKGGRLIFRGNVLTTTFTIIDTQLAPEHMVKGYTIENTGGNPLFVAHNAAKSSIGPDIIDPNDSPNIFEFLQPGDITESSYNKNVIKNIYLLAQTGATSHKTKLFW